MYKDIYFPKIEPMITNTVFLLHKWVKEGKQILAEGANAAMLDIDLGTYPAVTSSNTTCGGVCTGLGIPPCILRDCIGVVKAYTTRVGNGPFPTELNDKVGDLLVNVGHEYGTTTGRRRRCGWLDIPLLQYTNTINGYSAINITKLDVLSTLEVIKVGVAYKLGKRILEYGEMPSSFEFLSQVEVVYEDHPGWMADISKCNNFNDLPENAMNYLRRIEDLIGVPVGWIGVGPDRNDMIEVPNCSSQGRIMLAENVLLAELPNCGSTIENRLLAKVDHVQNGQVNLRLENQLTTTV